MERQIAEELMIQNTKANIVMKRKNERVAPGTMYSPPTANK